LGWAYVPDASVRHRSEEFDVEVRIHSRGFRGEEWSLEASAAARVLVLGDSFAFGWGVEEHERFSARLAAEFPHWLVVNAAVSGYGTDQELLVLRRLVDEVRPDLVVCVFCANDLYENAGALSYGKPKPRFVLTGEELGPLIPPVEPSWIARHSQLWRGVAKLRWERNHARREASPGQEWSLTLALLSAMKEAAGPATLLIVSEGEVPRKRLSDFTSAHAGITHLDLDSSTGGSGLDRFEEDGHWTAVGHAEVAAALSKRLRGWRP
jgi:hypothetical protein